MVWTVLIHLSQVSNDNVYQSNCFYNLKDFFKEIPLELEGGSNAIDPNQILDNGK